MNKYQSNGSIVERSGSGTQTYMAQVYGWMSCGLLLTALVAWYAAGSEAIFNFIFTNRMTFWGLIIAQLGLVFVLSGMVSRLSGGLATGLFMLYSLLTGLTLSSIFMLYTFSSIASTFFISAGTFAAMSIYGYATQRDLTGFGSFLFMGLIGIIIASVANFFIESSALERAISYIGVFVFIGLTAYDTQKLKAIGGSLAEDDHDNFRKYAILGALTLYLDFINLFLMLLRVLGDRR